MGYLLPIFLALACFALAEEWTLVDLRWPWAVPLLALAPYAFAALAHRARRRGRRHLAGIGFLLVSAAAPLLCFLALCVFGWHESVRAWTGSEGGLFAWPDFSVLIALAPFLLYQTASIDALARAATPNRRARVQIRDLQLRIFFASVAPILAFTLMAALVGLHEPLRARIEGVALWTFAFGALAILLLLFALPTIARNVWQTEPLVREPDRSLLRAVAEKASFRCRDLLVWRTGNHMTNAVIVGLGPHDRVVMFSDALLAQLDLRELAAVYAHEIGHAVHRHVPTFLAWAGAMCLGVDLLVTHLEYQEDWRGYLVLGAVLLAGYFAFGFVSRRVELQADLYAIDLLGDDEAMCSALRRLGGSLRDVTGWRHFSMSDRVRFLQRVAEDARVGQRLHRGLKLFRRLGLVLFLVAVLAEGAQLLSSYAEDSFYVDLRLGRYPQAVARARAHDLDPRSEDLAQRVSELLSAGPMPDPAELALRARAELSRDDPVAARDYLELAILAGAEELLAPALTLDAMLEGDSAAAAAALERVPEDWLEVLRAWLADPSSSPR